MKKNSRTVCSCYRCTELVERLLRGADRWLSRPIHLCHIFPLLRCMHTSSTSGGLQLWRGWSFCSGMRNTAVSMRHITLPNLQQGERGQPNRTGHREHICRAIGCRSSGTRRRPYSENNVEQRARKHQLRHVRTPVVVEL